MDRKGRLKFERIDTDFVRVDEEVTNANGRRIFIPYATISRNPYGRKLWQIHIEGYGLLTKGMFDCFSLSTAKTLVLKHFKESVRCQLR